MSRPVGQALYFFGVAVLGGVLLALGQSWASAVFAVGAAGAVFLGVSVVLNRRRQSR
jgi:hypothetical protein